MPKIDRAADAARLKLLAPVPATLHPAAVYLASLSEGSRATMRHALDAIASLLTGGECDALTLDWSKLRYQHTAAVRASLVQRFAPATAKKMVCALRRVLKEAARLGLMGYEDYARAVDLPRIDTPPQKLKGRALATDEIALLMDACESEARTIGIRDAAILAILRGGGLRREELAQLELKDYNPLLGELEIRSGKRKSYRKVYLPAEAIAIVEEWLEIRSRQPGALITPVRKGGKVELRHMSGDAVLKIVKRRGKKAGVADFSPHDFRRTFCSELLDDNDVVTVQKLAGHATPVTTAKYDRRGEETKRKAVERLSIPRHHRTTQ